MASRGAFVLICVMQPRVVPFVVILPRAMGTRLWTEQITLSVLTGVSETCLPLFLYVLLATK